MVESEKRLSEGRIVIAESDFQLRAAMSARLGRWKGWKVIAFAGGRQALVAAAQFEPDLAVVDGELCDADGREILKAILLQSDPLSVLVSSRREEADKIIGLGIGADAYIEKPASAREIEAVCKALVRRMEKTLARKQTRLLKVGDLSISPKEREVRMGEREVKLTKTEFDILLTLAERPGEAVERARLAEKLRQGSDFASNRFVDTHIKSLRKKLGPSVVRTVRGIGYALKITNGKEGGQ